jgi:hypothetical protein
LAMSSAAARYVVSVLVSFTPVRSRSPAVTRNASAQFTYSGGPWWMALRSPRKRVRGQPLRGFKSHLHRHTTSTATSTATSTHLHRHLHRRHLDRH